MNVEVQVNSIRDILDGIYEPLRKRFRELDTIIDSDEFYSSIKDRGYRWVSDTPECKEFLSVSGDLSRLKAIKDGIDLCDKIGNPFIFLDAEDIKLLGLLS